MPKPVLRYWDACLFLDTLNKTPGRIDVLEELWYDLGQPNAADIAVTSILTMAEVAFAAEEKKLHALDSNILAKIDAMWEPPIQMVEVYSVLTLEARRMMRDAVTQGWSLKAHDAIHFATCKARKCTDFLTYDDKLYKYDGRFGFGVKAPTGKGTLFSPLPAAPAI